MKVFFYIAAAISLPHSVIVNAATIYQGSSSSPGTNSYNSSVDGDFVGFEFLVGAQNVSLDSIGITFGSNFGAYAPTVTPEIWTDGGEVPSTIFASFESENLQGENPIEFDSLNAVAGPINLLANTEYWLVFNNTNSSFDLSSHNFSSSAPTAYSQVGDLAFPINGSSQFNRAVKDGAGPWIEEDGGFVIPLLSFEGTVSSTSSPVPEPSSILLMTFSLIAAGGYRWKKADNAS